MYSIELDRSYSQPVDLFEIIKSLIEKLHRK
jgi:hypothetical protein